MKARSEKMKQTRKMRKRQSLQIPERDFTQMILAGTFGVPVEEHLKESEVKQMDGYVSVGMLTGKTVPDTGLD